jgi:hypothetical protein
MPLSCPILPRADLTPAACKRLARVLWLWLETAKVE